MECSFKIRAELGAFHSLGHFANDVFQGQNVKRKLVCAKMIYVMTESGMN